MPCATAASNWTSGPQSTDVALNLMHGAKSSNIKKRKTTHGLLEDNRFKAMFKNPDFTMDHESDTFRLLKPVLSSLEEQRAAKAERGQRLAEECRLQEELELEGRPSSEDSSDGEEYVTELQRSQQQRQLERRQRPAELVANPAALPVRVLHGDSVREITGARDACRSATGCGASRATDPCSMCPASGTMTFAPAGKKRDSRRREKALRHQAERRKIRRSASSLGKTAVVLKNT